MYLVGMLVSGLRLELFDARSGDPSARVLGPGFARLLHSAVDPARERELFRPAALWGRVLLAAGTGLGYHLEYLSRQVDPHHAPLLILCDAFAPNVTAARNRLHDYPGNILCLHAGNAHAMSMLLRPHLGRLRGEAVQILRHPAAYRYCEKLCQDTVAAFLTNLPSPSAQGPIGSKGPGVLAGPVALPFGNHFLQQELIHGLGDLGLEALPFPENCEEGTDREDTLMRLFQQKRPRACISVNMKGMDREGILLEVCRRLGIPLHVWFVDDPRPIALAFPASQYGFIQAWCWERAYLPWLERQNFASAQWLPLAGDPHLFYPGGQTPEFPLMFTGSSMGSEFLNSIRNRYTHSVIREELAQKGARELLVGSIRPEQLPKALPEATLAPRNGAWFSSLVIHMASHAKRKEWLAPLLGEGLQFAGDAAGWRALFGNTVPALPDIDYRQGLCAHYGRTLLHVNITSCQMPTAVNQRVFDIALAGRLCLHDYQSDLEELFPADCFIAARSPAELWELARYYRHPSTEGDRIWVRARQWILANHTYAHRLRVLLGIT